MFKSTAAFGSFSVNDLSKAKDFYGTTLGLDVKEDQMGLHIEFGTGGKLFIYPKENHQAATYTVLNLVVENIDDAVKELETAGVKMEMYEGMHQDEKGVARGLSANMGPDIAWFLDPAGNILSVLQEK